MQKNKLIIGAALLVFGTLFWGCRESPPPMPEPPAPKETFVESNPPVFIRIPHPIRIKGYFAFMDSLLVTQDSLLDYELDEHLLVRANPWLINRLANTDYYLQKARGIKIMDQVECTVLRTRDSLLIPDAGFAHRIRQQMQNTVIDINLPEFVLRIVEDEEVKYTFPVRIGQDRIRYLAMAGRNVDLRTRTGIGEITRISKQPTYINPSNNRVYRKTRRDDGEVTALPIIPWLEPTIDGIRYGQLIHPTTNPVTLGKTSSNGCIGTRESDAWVIYYHAPIGTRVVIRYDRQIVDSQGDTILLPDIYPGFKARTPRNTGAALPVELLSRYLVDCPGCQE